jgi:hypothetical protein
MVLYMYLSRHVPCYYLEAMAQEAAASPKSAKCWYFKTQDEAMKIQKLSIVLVIVRLPIGRYV